MNNKTLGYIIKRSNLPPLEIELILAHMLGKSREYVIAHGEKKLTKKQISNIQSNISRRLQGEPLAYITGSKEFYGLDFKINKHVLIPRPETELIVDETLDHITHNVQHTTIIDLGTGSGCVVISIVKELSYRYVELSSFEFLATDISKSAIAVARQNAKKHNVEKHITFFNGNLLEPIIKNHNLGIKNYNLVILANLPYLTPRDIKDAPTIQHEPRHALNGGLDGLKYYAKLFKQIKRCKLQDMRYTIFCEIDPTQSNKIKQLVKLELPEVKISIKKDLRGQARLVTIKN